MKSIQSQRRKKPKFLRQEWFRNPSLGLKWRRPKGRHSKLRQHIRGKGFIPSTGYGSAKTIKGMHPCGLMEVIVSNVEDIKRIKQGECARIGSTVGMKKRKEMAKAAEELKVKVLNPPREGEK